MRKITIATLGLLTLIMCSCAGARNPTRDLSAGNKVTYLILQDENGTIISHATLPGLATAFTEIRTGKNGVDLVVDIRAEVQPVFQEKLNTLLTDAGYRRTKAKRAIRQAHLTCHKSFWGDGLFAGVSGNCSDVLVYRVNAGGPLGLMQNGSKGTTGLTPEALLAEEAYEDSTGPVVTCMNTTARVAQWIDIYRFLQAQVVAFDDPDKPGTIEVAYCSGKNRLDEIPADDRDPDLESVTRTALIRLRSEEETADRSGALLWQYVSTREEFPDNWLLDTELLTMLTPLLLEELDRCGISMQVGEAAQGGF